MSTTLPDMKEDQRAEPVPIRIVDRQRPQKDMHGGLAGETVAASARGHGVRTIQPQRPSGAQRSAYPRSSHGVVVRASSVPSESTAGVATGTSEAQQGADDSSGEQVPGPEPSAPAVEDLRRSYAMAVREALMAVKAYPVSARRARAEGTVVLRLRVDATGRVTDATVTEPSPHRILDEAALAMAARLKGLPPPPGGPIVVDVPLVYSLRTGR